MESISDDNKAFESDAESDTAILSLPYEVGEMVLMSAAKILYKSFSAPQVYSTLTSVCCQWYRTVTYRKWFCKTFRRHVIRCRYNELHLPLELWEMLLMKTTIMLYKSLGKETSVPLPQVYRTLTGVWSFWYQVFTNRLWFKRTVRQHVKRLCHPYCFRPHPLHVIDVYSDIWGIASLERVFYAVCDGSDKICAFEDYPPFRCCKDIQVTGLKAPLDIAACPLSKNLYVKDGGNNCIWRIKSDGSECSVWKESVDRWTCSLSVTSDGLVVAVSEDTIEVFGNDGGLVKSIRLPEGLPNPWHAIEVTGGHYVVSHGGKEDEVHRVCKLSDTGQILLQYGGTRGSSPGQLNRPVHIALSVEGHIFVVDYDNNRVVLLNEQLLLLRVLLMSSVDHIGHPGCVAFVQQTGRLFLGSDDGKVNVYQMRHLEKPADKSTAEDVHRPGELRVCKFADTVEEWKITDSKMLSVTGTVDDTGPSVQEAEAFLPANAEVIDVADVSELTRDSQQDLHLTEMELTEVSENVPPVINPLQSDTVSGSGEVHFIIDFNSGQQRQAVYERLWRCADVQWAMCMFTADSVEIVLQHNCVVWPTLTVLAETLQIPQNKLKLSKLVRDCPVDWSAIGDDVNPGAEIVSGSSCSTFTAYITTGNKQYALLSGHATDCGERVYGISRNECGDSSRTGKICTVVRTLIEGNSSSCLETCDFSIAVLEAGMPAENVVESNTKDQLYLNAEPGDLRCGQAVQKFCNGAGAVRGRVEMIGFSSRTSPLVCECVGILQDNGQPLHGAGESGMLLSTVPDPVQREGHPTTVDGLAVLVGLQPVEILGRTPRTYSLAVPVERIFKRFAALERSSDNLSGVQFVCTVKQPVLPAMNPSEIQVTDFQSVASASQASPDRFQ